VQWLARQHAFEAIDTLLHPAWPAAVLPIALLLTATCGQPGPRARTRPSTLQAGGGGARLQLTGRAALRGRVLGGQRVARGGAVRDGGVQARQLRALAAHAPVQLAHLAPHMLQPARGAPPLAHPITLPYHSHAPACAHGSNPRPQHNCALTSCSARVVPHTLQLTRAARQLTRSMAFVSNSQFASSEHACAHCWSSRAARWRNTARVEASRVRPSLLAAPACPAPVLPCTISAGPCRLCSYFTCMAQVRNC